MAKQKYLDARDEINNLRNEFATEVCVLRVGELITVVDRRMEFQGKVQFISHIVGDVEREGPRLGAETGWVVTGVRRKKITGDFGKWSFEIRSFDTDFSEGKWIVRRRSRKGF